MLVTTLLGWCLVKRKHFLVLAIASILCSVAIYGLIHKANQYEPEAASSPIDYLKSLPYLGWVPDEENMHKSGVTTHIGEKSYDAINIYAANDSPEGHLLDMEGNILHIWEHPENDEFHFIEMDSKGNLYAFIEYESLIKLDFDSNLLWKKDFHAHHDIAIDEENERVYVVSMRYTFHFEGGLPLPVREDFIKILATDGTHIETFSLLPIFREFIPDELLDYRRTFTPGEHLITFAKAFSQKLIFVNDFGGLDLFHVNTVEILNRDVEGLGNKGDLLVCIRNLNFVAVIDMSTREVKWMWGRDELELPHHPTLLDNGNVLIFDNGTMRGYSRIVEIDPLTKTIVWEYKADPVEDFYSMYHGSSQRLPNGNTLITNGSMGYVIEVTPEGEIVWEFFEPNVSIQHGKRKTLYRFMRLLPEEYPQALKDLLNSKSQS
jgi:hypothetical protein